MIVIIALGCDHGGYVLKEQIKAHLIEKGILFRDLGTYSEQSCDYPEYALAVATAVTTDPDIKTGILVCGTGIGICISANKVKGVRAACCYDTYTAKLTRQHNDTNILCLGGRVTGVGAALEIVDTFLSTEFEGGRHQRRVDMITDIENNVHENNVHENNAK